MPLKRIVKGGSDMRVGLVEMEEGAEMAITDYETLAVAGDLVIILFFIFSFTLCLFLFFLKVCFRFTANHW